MFELWTKQNVLEVTDEQVASIWSRILEVFKGGLLADWLDLLLDMLTEAHAIPIQLRCCGKY